MSKERNYSGPQVQQLHFFQLQADAKTRFPIAIKTRDIVTFFHCLFSVCCLIFLTVYPSKPVHVNIVSMNVDAILRKNTKLSKISGHKKLVSYESIVTV